MTAILSLLLAGAALANPCDLAAPKDAAFDLRGPVDAPRVHLFVEVHIIADDAEAAANARATLASLSDRGYAGTLVLPVYEKVPADVASVISWAISAGHRVGVRLAQTQIPRDITAGAKSVRATLKPVRKVAKKVTIAVTAPEGRANEAILGKAGLPTLLLTNAAPTGVPRFAGVFEGMPEVSVAFPAGPYAGPCGSSPTARPLTPRAADRVTQALHGAAQATGDTFVRVALASTPDDAFVLGRYLDEVLTPAKISVIDPEEGRKIARALFRKGLPRDYDPAATPAGKLIGIDDIKASARLVADTRPLPQLAADLTLVEAFQAYTLLLAARTEGDVVRLRPLESPSVSARPTVSTQRTIPRASVIKLATALAADNPSAVPTALPIDGTLYAATEVLVLFASCVRGDDPCVIEPVIAPDPNAPGLGWGRPTDKK